MPTYYLMLSLDLHDASADQRSTFNEAMQRRGWTKRSVTTLWERKVSAHSYSQARELGRVDLASARREASSPGMTAFLMASPEDSEMFRNP